MPKLRCSLLDVRIILAPHTHFTTLIDSFYRQLSLCENGKDVKFKHHQPSQGIASVGSECFRQREVAPSIKNIDGSSSTDFGVGFQSSLCSLHFTLNVYCLWLAKVVSSAGGSVSSSHSRSPQHHPTELKLPPTGAGCSFNQLSNLSHHTLQA